MKLTPDEKLDVREVLEDLEHYRPRRKGWTWRRPVAHRSLPIPCPTSPGSAGGRGGSTRGSTAWRTIRASVRPVNRDRPVWPIARHATSTGNRADSGPAARRVTILCRKTQWSNARNRATSVRSVPPPSSEWTMCTTVGCSLNGMFQMAAVLAGLADR